MVSGISAAIGYGLGVLLVWFVQALSNRPLPSSRRAAWCVLAAAVVVLVPVSVYLGSRWQAEIHEAMGLDAPSQLSYPVVVLLALGILNGVVIDGFFTIVDNSFRTVNSETKPDANPPDDVFRSGGPGRSCRGRHWATRAGPSFPTHRPRRRCGAPGGSATQRPIRVYSGLDSAPTSRERAQLAVRELQRTGGFSRRGESLGSFGAESAFSGADDISNRVDGMLLVGPPNRNELWREYVEDRDSGSNEALPVYQHGTTVRFADDPTTDLGRPSGQRGRPRVVYLQHASDPIVWWAPKLMVSRPDWLDEPRGSDVLPGTRWIPFVTFSQVTADMAFSTGVPAGHGHNYGAEPVAAWAEIAPPDGWTSKRTAELTKTIERE